ncbi:uncharacterized protein LOC129921130 [Episyrphus balteatus]|uniref:uncharacterized protein LOC129921130 n=1 Tax=Episyrphus balteatus TaxID=286459 RepID=UPI0024856535|nr:uncharacterized protein LOC129921130 [Episyrphus balteatus]
MCLRVNGCCRANLRNAGLAIGCLCFALTIPEIVKQSKYINVLQGVFPSNYSNTTDYNNATIHSNDDKTDVTNITSETVYLVLFLFDWITLVSLLFGITKNKHILLLPWLILRGLTLIVATPVVLFSLVVAFFDGLILSILISSAYTLVIGLLLWFWIVIYSLYHEIKDTKKYKPPPSQIA